MPPPVLCARLLISVHAASVAEPRRLQSAPPDTPAAFSVKVVLLRTTVDSNVAIAPPFRAAVLLLTVQLVRSIRLPPLRHAAPPSVDALFDASSLCCSAAADADPPRAIAPPEGASLAAKEQSSALKEPPL